MNPPRFPAPGYTPEFLDGIGIQMADLIVEHLTQFDPSAQVRVLVACRNHLRKVHPDVLAVLLGKPAAKHS